MHPSSNGGFNLQKTRNPMGDMTSTFNNTLAGPIRLQSLQPPPPPPPIYPKFTKLSSKLDYSIENYMPDMYRDFLSSQEKQNMLLLQFQTLKDKANHENSKEHRNRCITLQHVETVELILMLCQELRLNHIVRMRAIELYDRFMATYSEGISASMAKLSHQEKEKVKQRIEKQTMLRICSCIQLAHKFHYDMNDEDLNNKKIQNLLTSKSFTFNAKAIIRSEIRVYEALHFKLHFVTSLDVIEHLIPILHYNDVPAMQKFYQLCMKILDFLYLSHEKIYKRLSESKIFASISAKGYPLKLMECNVIFRSAAVLISAFFLIQPTSKEDRTKQVADICSIPQKSIIDFSTILIDELLLQ